MDFYNLQESDHQLLEKTMELTVGSKEYRDYLRKHFFNFKKLANKKCILVAEEDPRIQRIMQELIHEENNQALCLFADSVEEITDVLNDNACDLLMANYYLSEDEIDYEFWEGIRARYPEMEVIILSHINDREYYDMLEKLEREGASTRQRPASSRIKEFFDNVFGGWYGSH
jgi:CheY-like chemotaxis protein